MCRTTAGFLSCLLFAASATADEWKPLFNGKDLDGWIVKIRGHEAGDNFGETFRVEDGLLKVRFEQYEGAYRDRFGHLFYTRSLSHYDLRVECRFVGEQAKGGPAWAKRNSGIMIHGQSVDSMEVGQDFPVSLEVQLLAGLGKGPRPTANLCTPGTNVVMEGQLHTAHCKDSLSPTIEPGEWVTVEVEVRGDEVVRHLVNGELVMEYTQPQLDGRDPNAKKLLASGAEKMLASGTISLQAESHPVDFRTVELREMTP